jgi:soluble lytic murein transglycosylase-like protein
MEALTLPAIAVVATARRSRGTLAHLLVLTLLLLTGTAACTSNPAGPSSGSMTDPTPTATPSTNPASGPDLGYLRDDVQRSARAAGVDPLLVMAILYNEAYKPHDAASQRLMLQLDPGTSLGVANMHEAAFIDTRRGRDFAHRAFEDLIDDPALAVEAESWYLHDLNRMLPAHLEGSLARNELLALGYNTGPGNMRIFAKGVTPGPMAETYLREFRENWPVAQAALAGT